MEYTQLTQVELLREAFYKVKLNNGSAGVDEQSISDFADNLELGLQLIIQELSDHTYQALPLKQSQLIRPNKKPRTLAFPTVRDRIVHTAIAILLQPYFEQEFEHNSYGYRPGRSYLMAIEKVISLREKGLTHVFDADITSYFDSICQQILFQKLNKTDIDQNLIALIKHLLFSQQVVEQQLVFGKALGLGIPQGSPLSPLLANFYLDELDEHLINMGLHMIRYADDFVVCCTTQKHAIQAQMHTEQVLSHLNLELNLDKSQLTTFAQGFRFLGHHFIGNQVIDEKSSLLYFNNNSDSQFIEHFSEQQTEFEYLQQDSLPTAINKVIEDDYDWYKLDLELEQAPSLIKRTHLKTLYITQIGAVVGLNGNRLYISMKNEVIKTLPLNVLDNIMVFGRIQLTTDLIAYCAEHHINLIYCSSTGRYRAELNQYPSMIPGLVNQIKLLDNVSSKRIYSRAILSAKFSNSLKRLEQQKRRSTLCQSQQEQIKSCTDLIKKSINQLVKCQHAKDFFLLEAKVAKAYFQVLSKLIDKKWRFFQRNRLPPKDPVNALLSLGYNLLFNNTLCLIRKNKLHPDIGFLHSNDYQPSLALDLMEPFRSEIVDATVLMAINKHIFSEDDFNFSDDQCLLTKSALTKFIALLEQKLSSSFNDKSTGAVIDYRKAIDLHIKNFKQSFTQPQTFKGYIH